MSVIKANWFAALWIAAALVAFLLYCDWKDSTEFVGVVETRKHKLGPLEGGRVDKLFVSVGDEVFKGMELAKLDIRDLEESKKRLLAELARQKEGLESDRLRYRNEIESDRLKAVSDALSAMERRSELKARQAELDAVQREIDRLESAKKDGLGAGRNLSELSVRKESLKRFIDEQSAAMKSLGGRIEIQADSVRNISDQAERMMPSLLSRRLERIDDLLEKLAETEIEIDNRSIVAPCDGLIVDIDFFPGDTVQEFDPILTLYEWTARYVDAYIPETENVDLNIGDPVKIISERGPEYDTVGETVAIHPGYSRLPLRLAADERLYWARSIRIRLPDRHGLRPGEVLRLILLDTDNNKRTNSSITRRIRPDTNSPEKDIQPQLNLDPIKSIDIPPSLSKRSRFEPSGIAWSSSMNSYLVVSDDTGKKKRNKKAPWIFGMNSVGEVDEKVFVIEGLDRVNDLESVAQVSEGRMLLLASQGTDKGFADIDRRWLLEIEWTGEEWRLSRKIALLDSFAKVLSADEFRALGVNGFDEGELPDIEIEGMAIEGDSLLLGLKKPLFENKALIWRLRDYDSLLSGSELQKSQLELATAIDLGGEGIEHRGISALHSLKDGALLVLSNLPKSRKSTGPGACHLLIPKVDAYAEPIELALFDGRRPEGIATGKDGKIMIVFDAGSKNPDMVSGRLVGR